MADPVIIAMQAATRTWKQEAEERRRISKTDPVADALDYCAGEIAARLRSVESEAEYESVEARASREGVTPQTVRLWIRSNQLAAHDGAHGYRIPKSAVRVRRSA